MCREIQLAINFSTHGFYSHSEKTKTKNTKHRTIGGSVVFFCFLQIKVGKYTKIMLINWALPKVGKYGTDKVWMYVPMTSTSVPFLWPAPAPHLQESQWQEGCSREQKAQILLRALLNNKQRVLFLLVPPESMFCFLLNQRRRRIRPLKKYWADKTAQLNK